MVWILCPYFLLTLHGVLGAWYHFVQKAALSPSPAWSSCCHSQLLPDAGNKGRSKAVPQNKIVLWGCTMCGTSELRNTGSVLFWVSCKGLLVYAKIVSVFILGGFKVICRCSLSIENS